ncbi:hypothetical protein BDV95DRAFT_576058 [Massariosphaeria phaeospora]|uniref:Uncharacterized protein n=1 Tax=Massariosphaeria phaeospora TaxID=100035 RepID=A0A7C8I840_9PLEO|nr:hypothetical protein BDV95DRAFT_576058 [Massariosphaeria phaeospora]
MKLPMYLPSSLTCSSLVFGASGWIVESLFVVADPTCRKLQLPMMSTFFTFRDPHLLPSFASPVLGFEWLIWRVRGIGTPNISVMWALFSDFMSQRFPTTCSTLWGSASSFAPAASRSI